MIKQLSTAICSMLLAATASVHATTTVLASTQPFKIKFEDKMTELYQDYNLQGDFLVAMVGKKGLIYTHAINKQILNGEKASLNNDTPFFIASHTKAITGTLLKILEEEGKVDLDKSLFYYLPELIVNEKVDAKSITVRQLLNHTSGFTSILHTLKTGSTSRKCFRFKATKRG